ncbi:hypothetical protein D3C71_909940 [compost metagenome]
MTQRETPARYGTADGLRGYHHFIVRQPGDARRRFGLTIHHEKTASQRSCLLGKLFCQCWLKPSSGLGQCHQAGIAGPVKTQAV